MPRAERRAAARFPARDPASCGPDGARRARAGRDGARAGPPLFLDVDLPGRPLRPAPRPRLGPAPASALRVARVLEGGRATACSSCRSARSSSQPGARLLVGRPSRASLLPLYGDRAARRRGRHLAALVELGLRSGPASLPVWRCAARSRRLLTPGLRAADAAHGRARCSRRAAPRRCGRRSPTLTRDPGPGRRRRRRRAAPDRARPARRHPAAPGRPGDEPRPARRRSSTPTPRRRRELVAAGAPGGQGLHHRAARRHPRRAPGRAHRPRPRRRAVRAGRPLAGAGAARRRRARSGRRRPPRRSPTSSSPRR